MNLFSDGFESGNLNAWSGSETDGGDLSVTTAAKIHGNYGLSCLVDDINELWIRDNTPNAETRYRLRFYFDPNSAGMGNDEGLALLRALNVSYGGVFQIVIRKYSGVYQAYLVINKDSGSVTTSWYEYTDAPHCFEVDWKASSVPGANDGTAKFWIDGVLKKTLTGIDNDTKEVSYVDFGAIIYEATGTPWTLYLDDFASNDDGSEIGPISFASLSPLKLW